MEKVQRTDAEWRQHLTPQEYRVLRQADFEAALSECLAQAALHPAIPGLMRRAPAG